MKKCGNCLMEYEDHINTCEHCGIALGQEDMTPFLPFGTVLRDKYVINDLIGEGSFGATYSASDIEGVGRFAVKEYLPAEYAMRIQGNLRVTVFNDEKKKKQFHDGLVKFMDEAQKIIELKGKDGIVQVYDCFEANNTAYIIMDYVEGVLLYDKINNENTNIKYEPDIAIEFLLPLIKSLQIFHNSNIYHLDIAPKNIFITLNGDAKLIDFSAYRHATASYSRSLAVLVNKAIHRKNCIGAAETRGRIQIYTLWRQYFTV